MKRPPISYSIVRKTSMIIADTGERVHGPDPDPHRRVTFSQPEQETTPLLRTHSAPGFSPISENPYNPRQRILPPKNSLQTNSFKCSLAYTLASLFVLTPLSGLFGDFSSKHQVSTVSIYFNPARTVGSMIQSCGYVFFALAFGVVVGLCSMLTAHVMYDFKLFTAGLIILLILFCGVAFSVLAFIKITISNPTFDTSCTVAIIFMLTIVIKDDNIQKGIISFDQLLMYLALVLTGTFISAIVCFAVKPAYATDSLISSLIQLMDDISLSQSHILNAFVNGQACTDLHNYDETHTRTINHIIDINAHLGHSRFELMASGQKTRYNLLEKIVDSHLKLVRYIGGMAHTTEVLSKLLQHGSQSENRVDKLFQEFVNQLGPPINSFSMTLDEIMNSLPFDETGAVQFNPIYLRSLKAALQLYSEAREKALIKVYQDHSFANTRPKTDSTDDEAIIATCGNFSYLVEELGDEVYNMLTLLVNYEKETELGSLAVNWKFLASLPLMPIFPRQFKPSSKSKPFSKVTEALYPKSKVRITSFRVRLWKILQNWNFYETRFAFKVGFGSAVLSAPAFNSHLRPIFTQWKGEWAIIIYLIMMNRDLGAMTLSIRARLMGTLIGAALALLVWIIYPSGFFIFPVGGIIAYLAFNYILGPDRNLSSLGRFSLIAYNLVSLSSYTKERLGLIHHDNRLYEIVEMAFHRVVAVSVGVIWAVLITVCVFPDSARAAFRRNLSSQWMRMGMVWKANPLATMPRKDASKPAELQGIYGEEELQQGMVALKVRLSNASNEFRLKGKFDPKNYELLLKHTQAILNAYYSLGTIVSKSPTATSKELELIAATRQEINEICSTLFLYFYTASSSIRMGFPVPQELPRPQRAIHRLLRILETHRKQLLMRPSEDADMEDFVLFYSYILITITVTDNLTIINDLLGQIYGGLDSEIFSYT